MDEREDIILDTLIQQFSLHVASEINVFAQAASVTPSALLRETLAASVPLALNISTEKARSEFIIAPVLAEVRRLGGGSISFFSGVDFTVDPEVGLGGVCDYLFSLSSLQLVVQAPVLAVVEAKNDNIKSGLGQCVAEMLAAQRFKAGRGLELPHLYGVVTTGSAWKFLRLSGSNVVVDEAEYHISQPDVILGILVSMIRSAQNAREQQGSVPS